MPEHTENRPSQNSDTGQDAGMPTSATDGLTQQDLDRIVGGAQKFVIGSKGTKQDP